MSLSGQQRRFCEEVVRGKSDVEAYKIAYDATQENAEKNAWRLRENEGVQAELKRLWDKIDEKKGSAVLTAAEKRDFLARVVRARVTETPADSDLWNSVKITEGMHEYKLPDKLAAIKADNDLAGEGSQAGANDAIGEMLKRIRK